MEKANERMQDKLSKKIKVNVNHNFSQYLIEVAIEMNTQGHFSFSYNMMQYKVVLVKNNAIIQTVLQELRKLAPGELIL